MGLKHFDTIVIGTGVAGQTAASELAHAGQAVAVVDCRAYGGTCALRGCEPKKVLISAAEPVERLRAQAGNGVSGDARIDWLSLVAFKRGFTDSVPASIESWLTGLGVTALHGEARFTAPDMLDVGGEPCSAEHFVLATGAVPVPLGIDGSDLVIDSEAFMELDRLPERVAFVGGGFISFEFAHLVAAAGSQATIVHRSATVLRGFDPDLAGQLVESYQRRGIGVLTGTPVRAVRAVDAGFEVHGDAGVVVTCDLVVHGAGRVPNLERLGLGAGEVASTRSGVTVDAHMRSVTNSQVLAVGDVAASGPPLTTVGIAQARVAVRAILGTAVQGFDASITPSVVFADPPLATVGLSEVEAHAAGLDIEVRLTDTSGWASSRRVGADVGAVKTIVSRANGEILGAHLLGHHAEEVVNVFAAAMRGGLTADEMRGAIWAYPTASSEIVYLL